MSCSESLKTNEGKARDIERKHLTALYQSQAITARVDPYIKFHFAIFHTWRKLKKDSEIPRSPFIPHHVYPELGMKR